MQRRGERSWHLTYHFNQAIFDAKHGGSLTQNRRSKQRLTSSEVDKVEMTLAVIVSLSHVYTRKSLLPARIRSNKLSGNDQEGVATPQFYIMIARCERGAVAYLFAGVVAM